MHSSFGIVNGFTERISGVDHKFIQLPKSLLESFRVINVIEPDLKEIVTHYFTLLGFGEKHYEYTNKFIGFIRFISSTYEDNHLM